MWWNWLFETTNATALQAISTAVQALGTVVQAISTVVLAIITWGYVKLTQEMARQAEASAEATEQMVALTRKQHLDAAAPVVILTLFWRVAWPSVPKVDVKVKNAGCGPALHVCVDIVETPMVAAYELQSGGAEGRPRPPLALAPGDEVQLRFSTRNDYDQGLRDVGKTQGTIGTLRATYRDIYGRDFVSAAPLRYAPGPFGELELGPITVTPPAADGYPP
jgi:hypothetical protein